MKNLIKRHVQYLLRQQAYWLGLQAVEPPGTMFDAILDLSIALQSLKIQIWLALAGIEEDGVLP
jgi:hypothetical protein